MSLPDVFGLLFPNVWTVITQLCATAVLFFLMYKLAYKPVKKILETRSAYEQSKISEAEKLQEENKRLNDEAKNTITEANRSAEEIVSSARKEAEAVKEELVNQGREQSKELILNAQKQIDTQKAKMMEDMRSEIVDAAIVAAEKVLQDKVSEKSEKDDVDAFVKEVIG